MPALWLAIPGKLLKLGAGFALGFCSRGIANRIKQAVGFSFHHCVESVCKLHGRELYSTPEKNICLHQQQQWSLHSLLLSRGKKWLSTSLPCLFQHHGMQDIYLKPIIQHNAVVSRMMEITVCIFVGVEDDTRIRGVWIRVRGMWLAALHFESFKRL